MFTKTFWIKIVRKIIWGHDPSMQNNLLRFLLFWWFPSFSFPFSFKLFLFTNSGEKFEVVLAGRRMALLFSTPSIGAQHDSSLYVQTKNCLSFFCPDKRIYPWHRRTFRFLMTGILLTQNNLVVFRSPGLFSISDRKNLNSWHRITFVFQWFGIISSLSAN